MVAGWFAGQIHRVLPALAELPQTLQHLILTNVAMNSKVSSMAACADVSVLHASVLQSCIWIPAHYHIRPCFLVLLLQSGNQVLRNFSIVGRIRRLYISSHACVQNLRCCSLELPWRLFA